MSARVRVRRSPWRTLTLFGPAHEWQVYLPGALMPIASFVTWGHALWYANLAASRIAAHTIHTNGRSER